MDSKSVFKKVWDAKQEKNKICWKEKVLILIAYNFLEFKFQICDICGCFFHK